MEPQRLSSDVDPSLPDIRAAEGRLRLPGVPLNCCPGEAPEPGPELCLRDYWRVVHAHRWMILWLCGGMALAACLFNYLEAPVYRSTVTIQIDHEQPNTTRLSETLVQPPDQPDYIETQYKILKSRTLAKSVMAKLNLAERAEFRRSWYQQELDPPRRGQDLNPPVVRRFLDAITVSPGKGTRLVDLSVDSSDAEVAARAANALADAYIEQNLAAKWEATQKASEWLTRQLAELKAKLERSETDLLDYATRHSIIFVEEQKNITTLKLKQLEEELTRAEAARIEKQSAYLLLQDSAERRAPLPGNLYSDTYRELNLKLAEAQREYAQLLVTFAPGYPKAQRVKSQIDLLERSLAGERDRIIEGVRNDYLAAAEREKMLRNLVIRQTRSVNLLGDDIIQYNILKRDADTNRQLYEGLLQRLKEAGVSAGLRASNIRVLDPAEVPERPYRPRKLRNLVLALAMGLFAGVGLAFLSEHLSTLVRTPEEVEKLTGLPLLAVVPRTRSKAPASARSALAVSDSYRPSDEHSASAAGSPCLAAGSQNGTTAGPAKALGPKWQPEAGLAEAYRTLRSSLLLGSDEAMRRILITSPQPRDGKTTISVHLAWSLAQLGRRVLLVDADMRKPNCARQLGVGFEKGLSEYLEGAAESSEIIRKTSVENLWVVPAGRPHPAASDLLHSARLSALLYEAGARWDHVVIDSPPSLALSDARTIAQLVEGVVLVVSDGTDRASLKRTKQAFDEAGVRLLGFVMNRVNLDDMDYGYYREYGNYYYGSASHSETERS